MIRDHLPALIVIVPLLAAVVMPMLGRGDKPWLCSTITAWAGFAMTIALHFQVSGLWQNSAARPAVLSYPIGN